MTAKEFLEWALDEEYDLEDALRCLGDYLGRGDHFIQFPDADVLDEDGGPLENSPDEPAGFQEYLEKSRGRNLVLVGVKEAAEILGWDPRRVATYRSRGSFPEPIAELAMGPVWTRSQIEGYKNRD